MQPVELLMRTETHEERSLDFCPKTFDDYLGQEKLKEKLAVYTQAAKMRSEPLDHLLLFGPPGLGKTTLAQIMAHVMGVSIKIISGPIIERNGDLVAILSSMEPRSILFIDEIHRLASHIEEVLYSAMEQFNVDVIIGQGAGAKTISLPIQPFTLIGATTKSGMISAPLRSRFGIIERLDFYTDNELAAIVQQNGTYLGITFSREAALVIAHCSRGTPRIAKKLCRRIRDIAQVRHITTISLELCIEGLHFLGIDTDGLNTTDNFLLRTMLERFNGGPVGLDTLAALIAEDAETIETVIEPFLMRKGLLEKTPKGRQIPQKALLQLRKKYLGQSALFS